MTNVENKNHEERIVSIGLPVYNGEKFLREKLESIKNQTLKNYELIPKSKVQ